MFARDTDPTVGVHVLSEFVFCPRAGLLAFETEEPDTGEELERAPNLDYLPDFSILEIHAGLQQAWNALWSSLFWLLVGVITVSYVRSYAGGQTALVVTFVLFPFVLLPVAKRIKVIFELLCKLRIAKVAVPAEPDPSRMEAQKVNWWSMLKAGFTPVEYEEPHVDMSWMLAGKPWRVLVKGSLRIPVFRKRFGEKELFPQHHVRMAAYCHLIEVCEGMESPFGVVLFGDSPDGVTVPNIALNKQKLCDHLKEARRILAVARKDNVVPDQPRRRAPCTNCPLGRPKVHRRGLTETELGGRPISPFLTQGKEGQSYHCECGDRYGWVPPHSEARLNGLL